VRCFFFSQGAAAALPVEARLKLVGWLFGGGGPRRNFCTPNLILVKPLYYIYSLLSPTQLRILIRALVGQGNEMRASCKFYVASRHPLEGPTKVACFWIFRVYELVRYVSRADSLSFPGTSSRGHTDN